MIFIKTPEETKKMRVLGSEAFNILSSLKKSSKPGMTTRQIDELAVIEADKIGANLSSFGYYDFPGHLCISLNETVIHGIPDDRKLKKGDMVSIDMLLDRDGVFVDTAITFVVGGAPNKLQKKLMNVTREALNLGISNAVVGKCVGDISTAIQTHVEKNGFSVIKDFVGHGVGRHIHEDPQIPNFGIKPGLGYPLKKGMTIAIEPMVSAGDWQVEVLADGWTANMVDGSLSAHFEHTVLVTDKEPVILTNKQKSMEVM